MAGAEGGARRWLTYGCFGCLGLIATLVVIGVITVGVAKRMAGNEQVETRTLAPDVPESSSGIAPAEETGTETPPQPAIGRVILDLEGGDFKVDPGAPGEPIRVEATYDARAYEIRENLETGDGPGWDYTVSFRRIDSSFMVSLKEMMGGSKPEVHIYLPVDTPLDLELLLTNGGAQVELGGLWLITGHLQMLRGGCDLRISEPTRDAMESLSIHGKMGGVNTTRLGNASPRRMDIDFRMGGINLDLRGRWVADSEISLESSMGGTTVRLPRDVRVEGLDRGGVESPDREELQRPTLRFDVPEQIDNLQIIE